MMNEMWRWGERKRQKGKGTITLGFIESQFECLDAAYFITTDEQSSLRGNVETKEAIITTAHQSSVYYERVFEHISQ